MFVLTDPGLAKDPGEQIAANVALVGVGDPDSSAVPLHVLLVAARLWSVEAERTPGSDQLAAADRPEPRHQDG